MAIAPPAILKANDTLKANPHKPKSYRFSGIVGDKAHSFGYHLAPNDLPRSDYSLQTKRDKAGAKAHPNWASAWDLTFSAEDMQTVTRRLLNAAKAGDPRMKGVREFCGTLDGRNTYPWDLVGNRSEGIGSWDGSHLWHVHISFFRDATEAQILAVVEIICGVAARPVPYVPPKFPLKGLATFKTGDRGDNVKRLQQRLVKKGYAGKVGSGWSDGYYGPETAQAVNRFKKAQKWRPNGKVGRTAWNRLFAK